VRRVAALARLDFTDDEVEALADDLSRLLGYARRLDEVDTDGVEPMAPGAPAAPRHRRPDEPTRPLSQADALEDAPDASDGLFRVPGVLGGMSPRQ
jgi:aspartyl-tRNA(Asn)/glutamyl-tRNA(Gln) amidotransferase subunit C